MTREQFDEYYKKPVDIEKCKEALSRFVKGRPNMCIPANADDDDILILRALKELEKLRKSVK